MGRRKLQKRKENGASMIYGYARCSTNEKLQDINRQVWELKQQGATDTTIYLEYESGAKEDLSRLCELSYPTVYKYLSIIEEC